MREFDTYLWQGLYILKKMYDHNCGEQLLAEYNGQPIDSDDFYSISMEAIGYIFEDVRQYYNPNKEVETFVFFDPVITEFYKLCEQYEQQTKTPKEHNSFRRDMNRALTSDLQFDSYDYGWLEYNDTTRKNGYRLVLLLGIEFVCQYELPEGLLEAKASYRYHRDRLKKELERLNDNDTLIPFPSKQERRQLAA